MSGAELRWCHGGEARVVSLEGDRVTFESTTPSPPGSRIDGVLTSGSGRTVRVKVHLSRREGDGRFRIEGRPLDLTREARDELLSLLAPAGELGVTPPRDACG